MKVQLLSSARGLSRTNSRFPYVMYYYNYYYCVSQEKTYQMKSELSNEAKSSCFSCSGGKFNIELIIID